MRGRQGGLGVAGEGADRDSRWRLSADPYTNAITFGGPKEGGGLEFVIQAPHSPSGYAPDIV